MGLAFRLMLFMVLLNIAVGLISWIGGASWTPPGMSYREDLSSENLKSDINNTVSSPLDPNNNLLFRLIDIVSLGVYSKIQIFFSTTIYALPTMLVSIGLIPFGMSVFLTYVITLIYVIGIVELFTGKDISLR